MENRNFFGKGWPFPLRPDATGRVALIEGPDVIRRSMFLILGTARGERVMRPDFGCGIHELVFQPNTPNLRGAVESQVTDSLVRWEPRIDVLQVRAESGPEGDHQLLIRINYRVRHNNALFNMVFPFYLNEGVGR